MNKSISKRIGKGVLIVCVITIAVSAAFSIAAQVRLQQLMTEMGYDIGASASAKSATALLAQSVSATQGIIAAQVEILELLHQYSFEYVESAVLEMTAGGVEFFALFDNGQIIVRSALGLMEADAHLPAGALEALAGERGAISGEFMGISLYIIWDTMPSTGWKLVGLMPTDIFIASAEEMRDAINAITETTVHNARRDALLTAGLAFAVLASTMILVLLYAKRIARRIAAPIALLTADAVKIGMGEIEYVRTCTTDDEIQVLSETINKMVSDLCHVTGEKERISAELSIAAQIQASMLPCEFPAFPHFRSFDIYASMLPAKEVGGDFYDFFLIGERKLAVVVADVSGKGVPAALFMAMAKILIKDHAQTGKSPCEIFEAVNKALCENNNAQMFVTAFLGIWNMDNMLFTYANAGHNPPLIKLSSTHFEWLPTKPGFVLAGMENTRYKEDEITLSAGDTLFLYTDGVTEAENSAQQLFTAKRLLDATNVYKEQNLHGLLEGIKKEIDIFAGNAEQADDITMLLLEMKSGGEIA